MRWTLYGLPDALAVSFSQEINGCPMFRMAKKGSVYNFVCIILRIYVQVLTHILRIRFN